MSNRVPLVPEKEVSPSQRALYDAFAKRTGKNYSAFKTMRADGAFLGPWSAWLQVPKIGEPIRQLLEDMEAMPGLSKAAAQVVILVTGTHFNAAYAIYAHAAVGAQEGLSEEQIATLSTGVIPSDLDTESTIAAQVAGTLLKGGVLPGPLFKLAVEKLGMDGFNRVVYQVATYCITCITLNAFDVPDED